MKWPAPRSNTRLARLRSWRQFAAVSGGLLIVGAVYGTATGTPALTSGADAFVYAAIIGLPLVLIEIHGRHIPFIAATRRWPFGPMIIVKSAGYAVWTIVGMSISAWLTHQPSALLSDILIHRDKLAAVLVGAAGVNLLLAVNRLLGPGVLLNFLRGRYHHPRREMRGFVFIDICNSTSLAQHLGDLQFHVFVNDALTLIADTAMDTGGEVHDYIGDLAMLTWPAKNPSARLSSPIAFFCLLENRLSQSQAYFRSTFGEELRFRAAIHAGPVSVGEIGDAKQKIVYLGDTVNTVARLEHIARRHGERIIMSKAALGLWPLPPRLTVKSIGSFLLRGRAEEIEVFRLEFAQLPSAKYEQQELNIGVMRKEPPLCRTV